MGVGGDGGVPRERRHVRRLVPNEWLCYRGGMGRRWRFPNYSLLAQAVQRELERGDVGWAWRILTEAVADSQAASDEELVGIVAGRAGPAGGVRADAGVGAVAEWLCATRSLPVPRWTQEGWRELDRWWFVVEDEELKRLALVESPASFAKRGIF